MEYGILTAGCVGPRMTGVCHSRNGVTGILGCFDSWRRLRLITDYSKRTQ
jgi:hypothetical protein